MDAICWCNIVARNMLRAFGRHVAQCCVRLANPAQHVVTWSNSVASNMLHPWTWTAHALLSQSSLVLEYCDASLTKDRTVDKQHVTVSDHDKCRGGLLWQRRNIQRDCVCGHRTVHSALRSWNVMGILQKTYSREEERQWTYATQRSVFILCSSYSIRAHVRRSNHVENDRKIIRSRVSRVWI